MPQFLEDKLKQRYGANSAVPYKIMNSIGAMRGNRETAKGRAMEAKHNSDVAAGRARMADGGVVSNARQPRYYDRPDDDSNLPMGGPPPQLGAKPVPPGPPNAGRRRRYFGEPPDTHLNDLDNPRRIRNTNL